MYSEIDPRLLPMVENALSRPEQFPAMQPALAALFQTEQNAGRRPFNRGMVAIFVVLFDLFLLSNLSTVPALVPLSAALRLGVVTPLALIFIALDWRGRLGRLYDPALLGLSLAAALSAGVLSALIRTPTGLPDVQAAPLILLATGMSWRMTPLMAAANAILCSAIFVAAEVMCPVVPRAQLGSMIMTVVAISGACMMFARRMDWRDRRVFLLNLNEQIRRALVAEQNTGLLREVQTDSLTGAANRRCFDETLAALWQAALESGEPVALAMIDVDHFKRFNDHYGHQDGDDCLRRVAVQLRGAARRGDVVARYGGEEFAAILPGATMEDAVQVAERMRAAVEAMRLPHEGCGQGAIVTVSVGVASVMTREAHTARRLIEAADRRLYMAKENGRNRIGAGTAFNEASRQKIALVR